MPGMIFNTVTGGGEKGFVPTIVVNVDTGSTVTCSNGSKTFTATSVGGTCSFEIPSFDTWVVTATLSGESATQNVIVNEVKVYTINLYYTQIYGVEWDGSSTTSLTRTDNSASFTDPVPSVNGSSGSSPFDNCYPWKDMTVVEDSEAGTLVSIPKFYYKWTRSGTSMKLQISTGPMSGFSVSPAHQDRGDGKGERDIVYVGKYLCDSSTYKSLTGVTPLSVSYYSGKYRSYSRSLLSSLGSTIWQWDYAIIWTIRMLYLVEFADWNSQAKIGIGYYGKTGGSDTMSYHTGTVASSLSSEGAYKYRGIENLWSETHFDGLYYSSSGQYIILNPSNFSDDSNGTLITSSIPSGGGYITTWSTPTTSGYDWALTPSAYGGSASTYIPDYGQVSSSVSPYLTIGGWDSLSYAPGPTSGLFRIYGHTATMSGTNARLMKLP